MRRFAALLCAVVVAGCGGGGSRAAIPPGGGAAPLPPPTASATLVFTIPRRSSAAKRSPQWLTAATSSIALRVIDVKTHGTTNDVTSALPPAMLAPQIVSVANTTGNANVPGQCGPDPSNGQNVRCTEVFAVPEGDVTVTIAAYDAAAAAGNVIAQQGTVVWIQGGQANTFAITLDANVASLAVTPAVAALAGDANGPFTVVGNGDATAGIVVSDAHGTPIDLATPGAPVLSVSSSNASVLTASTGGSVLTLHPVATSGSATVTVKAGPANSSGATPGDGLTAVMLSFTVSIVPGQTHLYVGTYDRVNVFPLDASGSPAPQRSITGLFYGSTPGPNRHASYYAGVIAAPADGTLAVGENIKLAAPGQFDYRVDVYGPNATGGTPQQSLVGYGEFVSGIAVGPNAELDVLTPNASRRYVQRYVNGRSTTRVNVAAAALSGLAADAAGGLYVSSPNPGHITEFAPGAVDDAAPVRSFDVGGPSAGPIAAAADGTLYVAAPTAANDAFDVLVYPPQSTTSTRSLGPFSRATLGDITSLAIDARGELYVAFCCGSSTSVFDDVRVFARGAGGMATPLRTLHDPIVPGAGPGIGALTLAVGP